MSNTCLLLCVSEVSCGLLHTSTQLISLYQKEFLKLTNPGTSPVAGTLGSQCRGAWIQSLIRELDTTGRD